MNVMARLAVIVIGALFLVPGAAGAPQTVSSLLRQLDHVESLVAGARSGDPDSVEERYEEARELLEMISGRTTSVLCARLLDAISRAASAHVLATEGFDRLDRVLERRGEAALASAMTQVASARARCPRGSRLSATAIPQSPQLIEPLAGEAFFGIARARRPALATNVELRWNGRVVEKTKIEGSLVRRSLTGSVSPGRGDVELRFLDAGGATVGKALAEDVWLLPWSGNTGAAPARADRALSRRLATLAAGFSGYAGISVYDLATGFSGGWNEDARFPAASLVKLGVLVAALDRFGPRPENSSAFYDMRTMAAWSSNLGANRLLELLGNGDLDKGRRIVESRLRQMGATRSTYPGDYRVGTSIGSGKAAPHEPPLVSQRTTTARDMTRVLATLQAAATGSSKARRASGLSSHEAKVALALLLSSEPRGDNLGLFRPALPKRTPVAQKHGWISSARHSAAIVYGPNGPVVVVLLTYRDGLSLSRARELGRHVLRAAGLQ